MNSAEWNTQRNGLRDAILDPDCMPDCYVELTVIQFACNLPGGARTEIGPIVITDSNRSDVADDVSNITKSSGNTPIEAGIDLAVDEITSSPYFAIAEKQIINIGSDVGEYTVNKIATETARDNAIAAGIDEISTEGIGNIPPVDIDWLRDEIVYPQPGSIAPPFIPGWVYMVGTDAGMFKLAICEKIMPSPTPTPTPTPTLAPPAIKYSPGGGFHFNAKENGDNPKSKKLMIRNAGPHGCAPLEWTLSDDADWLTLDPTSGTTLGGDKDRVNASVDITGMSAGSYSAVITIEAPGATNTPQQVNVILKIK